MLVNLIKQSTKGFVPLFGNAKSFTTSKFSSSPSSAKSLWKKYLYYLEIHPLKTKAVTSAVIAGFGDCSCQLFLENDKAFDYGRWGRFTLLGGILVAPVLHGWYGVVGQLIKGTSSKAVVQRVVLDQFLFAPVFVPVFFTSLLTLEAKSWSEIQSKLQQDLLPTLQTNWSIWIPAQVINFRFVMPQFQVLFSNVVGLLWNSYLSYMSYREHTLILPEK